MLWLLRERMHSHSSFESLGPDPEFKMAKRHDDRRDLRVRY